MLTTILYFFFYHLKNLINKLINLILKKKSINRDFSFIKCFLVISVLRDRVMNKRGIYMKLLRCVVFFWLL